MILKIYQESLKEKVLRSDATIIKILKLEVSDDDSLIYQYNKIDLNTVKGGEKNKEKVIALIIGDI